MSYQMSNSLGSLFLLLLIFATLCFLVILVYRIIYRKKFARIPLGLVGIWILYAILLLTVSVFSKEHLIPLGSTQCFDDWCASVLDVSVEATSTTFKVHVASEARRVAQTPDHPVLQLIDSAGNIYAPSTTSPRVLNSSLNAGESFDTNITFTLPIGAIPEKVLLTEGSGPPLIGDQNSYLHKKMYFYLK